MLVGVSIFTGFLFAGLVAQTAVFAEEDEEECDPCYRHSYYTCTQNCGGNLKDIYCDGCCGGGCYVHETVKCEDWQKCDPSEAIGGKCYCDGSCLEKPKDPVYYNNPEYTHQPEHNVGNLNVKLPVKLEWTDVPGWKNKGGPGSHKKDPYGPQSYVITFKNTAVLPNGETYTKTLPESEFESVRDGQSCLFKSNADIPWTVKACCTTDGKSCGPEASWNFISSNAPEPKTPYDPDWVGNKAAVNLGAHTDANTLQLEWCAIPSAQTYELLAYRAELNNPTGQEECLPPLWNKLTCNPYIIKGANKQETPPNYLKNSEAGFFTKDYTYSWKVRACEHDSKNCTDWSQKWKFKINDYKLEPPILYSPSDDPTGSTPVGLPVNFSWKGSTGSLSYVFELNGASLTDKEKNRAVPNVVIDYPTLKLDTLYTWRVKPCWDEESKRCEDSAWSKGFTFKTTGRPPIKSSMEPSGNSNLPAVFEWENVPGAKSFDFHIEGNGINTDETVTDPRVGDVSLLTDKTYTWKVKTCARGGGELCGQWSDTITVAIKKLGAPANPDPADGSEIYFEDTPRDLTWDSVEGAGAYKVTITYASKDPAEKGACPTGVSKDKIVPEPRYFFDSECLGTYIWQVQSCLDAECRNAGEKSPEWTFTVSQNPENSGNSGGFVVCGRNYDDPDTSWNEREDCNIGHLFIMAQLLFEFLLFKLSIIILIILVLITGIIYYTSLGDASTMERVKSLWRAAGIGYLVLLFGWIVVSIMLSLLGYQFGSWWKIKN